MSRYVHPEQNESEVFLGNCWNVDFSMIGWKTKRKGLIAYTSDGRAIPKSQAFRPVFVAKQEIAFYGCDVPERGAMDFRC